jgi:hypothetical protein
MTIVLNGTTGITNDGGYTGDGVVFANTTPANTLVTDTSGNVMIGTTSASAKLSLNTGAAGNLAYFTDGVNTDFYIKTTSSIATIGPNAGSTNLAFQTSGTERGRFDTSGNFLVGTTSVPSGGQKMNIAGGITPTTDNSFIFGNSGLRWQALYAANGTIQTSDERDKTAIVDSPLGLAFVNSLRPVAYKFKVGKNQVLEDGSVVPVAGTRQHFGLLAQDVKQTAGDVDFGGWILTDTADAASAQGLRYDEFIAPIIKAIQEQQAIITALTARVEALEGTQP